MPEKQKIFFLDAYALIFRSYYAFISNPMKNSRGLNTSTVFGFVLSLDELLRKENPDFIGVVFDPPGPTFRNDMFPDYKANREATPEDIKLAVPWIKKILQAYNIPSVELSGFEADDVIGTLARKAEKENLQVYMMTPDKDFAQLVSENIFMYKPARMGNGAEILGVKEVCEKFEIETPLQVIDILGLWGDSADNVPGVPGIGEKTAKKLISEYKSIENVLENIEDFKGKQKENLLNFKEQALLSKKLVTIEQNVAIDFNKQSFEKEEINVNALAEIFDELEFKTLKNKILGQKPEESPIKEGHQGNLFGTDTTANEIPYSNNYKSIETEEKKYNLIESKEDLLALCDEIKQIKAFCFDTETTGLDPHDAILVGLAISFSAHRAFYIPAKENIKSTTEFLQPIAQLLADENILKVGQNLKYDIRVLKKYSMECSGEIFDTMVAHYLLQPERRHGLNVLAEEYLNYTPVKIEKLIGEKGKAQRTMDTVPVDIVKDYACEDADLTWQLFEIFSPELERNMLSELAMQTEMPLVYVLAEMEHNGVHINTQSLKEYALDLNAEAINLESKIYELAGERFNISSPKQLGEILFDKLKISDNAKKTKTKQYSTGEDILSDLADKHEIVNIVLEFRSVKKLLSTYIEALPKLISKHTKRLHTSYNQTLVATGRLSSNNPNLQNIPIREERGREIRKSFIPQDEDHLLIAADYSQIELRLMAHLSRDENMIASFNRGEDIHTATAAKIYGIEESDVSREMRSQAKTANFGIIYGISAFGLAQRLKIKRTDAKELIDGYFRSFPAVKEYMDESIRKATEEGCVYTILGRKRFLPDILSRNSVVRGVAERNAINAPIQGSAADIIKIAMVNIFRRMKKEKLKSKMILQVHDELVFEVKKSEESVMKSLIREEMESAYKLSVPLTVDMGTGSNWLEAH
ncbi:MAG: DNA polymerase I [Bacteroidales bacterium]|nr:DNA polymerase I [Bacteroidales bacterium]MCF8389663.1 DNA polymerase I [Bacteroidales bacterium]